MSDDDRPGNTYGEVERVLWRQLSRGGELRARWSVPVGWMKWGLRLVGRQDIHPAAVYDDGKLKRLGFIKPSTLDEGLATFGHWYRNRLQIDDFLFFLRVFAKNVWHGVFSRLKSYLLYIYEHLFLSLLNFQGDFLFPFFLLLLF